MAWTPNARKEYARRTAGYASSVTEEEWKKFESLMPIPNERARPRKTNLREVIDAIFYLLQSACQWDMLPKEFPPGQTVYGYFQSWIRTGLWERIHDVLYRACGPLKAGKKARRWRLSMRSPPKPPLTHAATSALTQART